MSWELWIKYVCLSFWSFPIKFFFFCLFVSVYLNGMKAIVLWFSWQNDVHQAHMQERTIFKCGKFIILTIIFIIIVNIIDNYLKKFLLHAAFSVGCKWSAEHTFRSEVLPSSCPLYPNLQVSCKPCFWEPLNSTWIPQTWTKSYECLEICNWKRECWGWSLFSQYVKAGSGQDSKWIRGSMKKE